MSEFKKYETTQFRLIFPENLNNRDSLFGGEAMKWMDEVAYITALRFAKQKVVTISAENFKFLKPIVSGSIIQIIGNIFTVSALKIGIRVEIFIEDIDFDEKQKAIEAVFYFAAVNDDNKPVRMNNKNNNKTTI